MKFLASLFLSFGVGDSCFIIGVVPRKGSRGVKVPKSDGLRRRQASLRESALSDGCCSGA